MRREAIPAISHSADAGPPGIDRGGFLGNAERGRNYSADNARMIDRLPKDQTNYDVDLVVVDAGRNDFQAGIQAFGDALGEYLRAVRAIWPDAKVVTVVPWVMSADPGPEYADVAAVVRRQTDAVGGVTIDPLAEGGYDDADLGGLATSDGLRPTQAGHTLIGTKLVESLQRYGVEKRAGADR